MADDKRAKLKLKRRKIHSNDSNSPGIGDIASAEKSPRLAEGTAFVPTSSQTAASREVTGPRIDSMPSEARGDREGGVGHDGGSGGDLKDVFELLLPECGDYVWTDFPDLPPASCQEDDPCKLKSEATLLLKGKWPSEVTWSPLPLPQS